MSKKDSETTRIVKKVMREAQGVPEPIDEEGEVTRKIDAAMTDFDAKVTGPLKALVKRKKKVTNEIKPIVPTEKGEEE